MPPGLAATLAAELDRRRPDLIVVSGDITQRGRPSEFAAARSWFAELSSPLLVVPGNHDIPLLHPIHRLWTPFARYERGLGRTAIEVFSNDEMHVVGLRSPRRWLWKSGRLSGGELDRLRQAFVGSTAPTRVLVLHHPLIGAGEHHKPIGNAGQLLVALAGIGVDIVLAGHWHRGRALLGGIEVPGRGYPLLAVHAGTALSDRRRSEPNAFNWLELADKTVKITQCVEMGGGFTDLPEAGFSRKGGFWLPG